MSEELNVYVNIPAKLAAYSTYNYEGMPLLFKCPRAWIPKTQTEFEQACAFNGVTHAHLLSWQNIETF